MSRANLTFMSLLLVAALAIPASAQTPTDTAATDTTPKKKGRFGGMMDKAKKVAGNKTVQDAAKGAATGVACTVVPGATAVSMATGSGPCATSGLAGLVSGKGASGIAATAASTAASGAAAKAMGKMGGTSGAAAAGALGAMGGASGMKNAATSAVAQAAAARAMGAAGGMPNAAAMAAAQAAAMRSMGAAPGGMPDAAAMAAAQAAAMQMMQNAGALPSMGAALGGTGGKKIETVDFRELKALLPASLQGMKRTNATGQKNAAMGMQISSAEGEYSSDDGKSAKLEIADIGSMSGLAGIAAYAWAANEIDSESDNAYEKTTKFKGYKALEKYNKQSKSGELSVLVGSRFVVGVTGHGIDMDALKSALSSVDLAKLSRMKAK